MSDPPLRTGNRTFALPVVAAQDYRHAMPGEMWELLPASITGPVSYRSQPRDTSSEAISRLAEISLQTPVDFPPIADAVLPGDHVALAVDPNVPRVADVIAGALASLKACGTGRLSVVLWAETPDVLLAELKTRFQNFDPDAADALDADGNVKVISGSVDDGEMLVCVIRHQPRDRTAMRYVAADEDAEAIYLSRDLVDADLILPIVVARIPDAVEGLDKAGVFPMFADAATIRRYQRASDDDEDEPLGSQHEEPHEQPPASTGPPKVESESARDEVGWLLGVQLMMMVSSDAAGDLGRILAGTPDAIRRELQSLHVDADTQDEHQNETLPRSELVIAALDGDVHAQTWPNVARAAIAAARHVEGQGTIVVWSRLNHPAGLAWQQELNIDGRSGSEDSDQPTDEPNSIPGSAPETEAGHFEDWRSHRVLARKLATLIQDHRILLHSELPDADVESLGLGVITSVAELRKLGESFQGAGVLRAAQFHDGSVARFESSHGSN